MIGIGCIEIIHTVGEGIVGHSEDLRLVDGFVGIQRQAHGAEAEC